MWATVKKINSTQAETSAISQKMEESEPERHVHSSAVFPIDVHNLQLKLTDQSAVQCSFGFWTLVHPVWCGMGENQNSTNLEGNVKFLLILNSCVFEKDLNLCYERERKLWEVWIEGTGLRNMHCTVTWSVMSAADISGDNSWSTGAFSMCGRKCKLTPSGDVYRMLIKSEWDFSLEREMRGEHQQDMTSARLLGSGWCQAGHYF